jgi:hypothetical protein
MNIDFTTTAMPRPDILDECYSSFDKNLIGINLKENDLYINIDPFPYYTDEEFSEIKRLSEKCIKVGKKYFKNVFPFTPRKANYSKAYKRIWGNAKTDFIFNIEDDWRLDRRINIKFLIKEFKSSTLYQVVLRAYNYKYPACCTSPSLLHKRWYKVIAKGLKSNQNPESQIHKNSDGRFGTLLVPNNNTTKTPEKYIVAYPEKIVVSDIGREWVKKSPYVSPIEHNRDLEKKYGSKDSEGYKMFSVKIKKVDFLNWVIDPKANPLKWLKEYQYEI